MTDEPQEELPVGFFALLLCPHLGGISRVLLIQMLYLVNGMPSTCNSHCNASWWRRGKKKHGRCSNKSVLWEASAAKWEVFLPKLSSKTALSVRRGQMKVYLPASGSQNTPDSIQMSVMRVAFFHCGATAELRYFPIQSNKRISAGGACVVSPVHCCLGENVAGLLFQPRSTQRLFSTKRLSLTEGKQYQTALLMKQNNNVF